MKRWLLSENGNFYKACLHLHTTLSDGDFTPEEVKQKYRDAGYSILAFTDHDVFIPHNDFSDENFLAINSHEIEVSEYLFKPNRYQKTYHLNFYAKDRNATLTPVFSEKRVYVGESPKYVTEEMKKTDVWACYSVRSINEVIRIANDNGFFVTYNHPVWSLQNYEDYAGLEGLWGIEVWNTGCVREGMPDTTVPFDDLLREGKDVFPICSDDSHVAEDFFGGWTMVKADSLDYDDVIKALLAGNFYSSTGPEIYELSIEDKILTVKTNDIKNIRVVSDWRAPGTKTHTPEREGDAFVTRIPLKVYRDNYRAKMVYGWKNSYFRLEINGRDGTHAYTPAYRFKDLPELYQ